MSLGTILTSMAVLVLLAAYVARPFRRERADVDFVIEGWVRQMRSAVVAVDEAAESDGVDVGIAAQREVHPSAPHLMADIGVDGTGAAADGTTDRDEPVNFCPYCGRRVESDHVFCPKCGRQLTEGAL